MTKLSVNINKIATLRNSRGGDLPSVVQFAKDVQRFGAQGVTIHPRPDERHIRYQDARDLKSVVHTEYNIEGNPTPEFVEMVLKIKPTQVTLVPDAENAITSNAGWDTKKNKSFFSKKITFDNSNTDSVSIFKNILDSYNDAFCYFFYTPKEGVWLGASPELLFKKEKNSILTMALAGTKFNISSEWGDKEYSEQKIVQDEIIENLSPLCSSLSLGETETVSAGKIQHLKTSFEGTTQASTIKLINALFPSSAIAGFPRKTALKLISKYELHERSFYSGFLGACKGNDSSFFVNLRCLNVKDDKISLYVGSGITKDSDPDNEWMEILKKSETMLNVIF